MKQFLDKDFILDTPTAIRLYHSYAEQLPIIDYHCHLSPQEIAENKKFKNISQIWLWGDHYKWRAMRTNGVKEKFISGEASDREKFTAWAQTIPSTIRNPLFHWTHMELKNVFHVNDILNSNTAHEIYDTCNSLLQTDQYTPQALITKAKVEVICTTDDPVDSLEWHMAIAKSDLKTKVLPTWRADKALALENLDDYNTYIDQLQQVAGVCINTFDDLIKALSIRHKFFNDCGCKLSDHGLDKFYAEEYTKEEINNIFSLARSKKQLSKHQIDMFKSAMLYKLAELDHSRNWTQQFHVGAIRNNNAKMFKLLGADTGFDSIGDKLVADDMSAFFSKLVGDNVLAKTILYNLNPSHNYIYASMIANFQDDTCRGKIQWGSAWWFLDQKDGIKDQLNVLSSQGLLSRFVGMLTDSRSFLSYSRHEYFRRILCNIIGEEVEKGLIPNDDVLLKNLIEGICYYNAKEYFQF